MIISRGHTTYYNPSVGGRNLIYNSGIGKVGGQSKKGWRASGGTVSQVELSSSPIAGVTGAVRVTNTGSSAAQIGIAQDGFTNSFIAGESYSQGAWIRGSGEFTCFFQPIWKDANNTGHGKDFVITTDWQYYKTEGLKLLGTQQSTYSAGYFYAKNVPTDGWVEVCGMKLERGNTATDWTPAPEDVASDIDDASKTATNYITFSEQTGLMVHAANDPDNYLKIDSDSIDIYQDSTKVAEFGETTILGDKEAQHVEISPNGYELISAEKTSIFNIKPSGTLSTTAVKEIVHPDENDKHTVTLLHTPLGDGYRINGLGHINYTLESGKPQKKDITFVLQPGTINEKSVSTSRYTYTVVFNPNANTVKISISGVGAVSCSLKYVSYYYASYGTDLGAATFAGAVYMNSMAGAIQMYAGTVGQNVDSDGRAVSTAPTGWLLCDGSAISRTIYPYLYAAIGDYYGGGDGSTTFNLPDMRGRFPLGSNGDYPLNAKAGSTDAVVVSHTHSTAASGYFYMLSHGSLSGGDMGSQSGSGRHYPYQGNRSDGAYWGTQANTGAASSGVSGAGKNMPPYIGINFIIATGETS